MVHFAILIVLSLTLLVCHADDIAPKANDSEQIQVLIDVSGSMKQNDPQNLRVEATQLLINLLPDASKATLWLFAEDAKLLSKSDKIDGEWRQNALKATKSIHSQGIFTDIEKAIKSSLEEGFASSDNKNLIILTDGMVDISKDIMVSADSRERILSEWIPKLQQQKIKVQTIGLSDQVDKELLERLAFDTGGWHESAHSAEQLERLFFKSVQKAAPRDALPLTGNQFSVDSSVQEFSLLVFKTANATATQLVNPDRSKLSREVHADNVSWLETKRYDLITVKAPSPGEWHIEAVMDPDNQVMILTDLKMHLEAISSFVPEKQSLPIKLHFTEKGEPISRRDFLELVTIALSLDQQPPISLEPVKSEPGYFTQSLIDISLGKHNIKLIADGKTFKREIERDFEVVSAPITVKTATEQEQRSVTLTFQPDISVIDAQSLVINILLNQSNQETETAVVAQTDGNWIFKLEKLPKGESVLLNFDIVAKSLDGNSLKPVLAPMTLDDTLFPTDEKAEKVETIAPEPTQVAQENQPTAPPPSPESSPDVSESNWLLTLSIIIVSNVLLGAIGFFAFRLLKKATHRKQNGTSGEVDMIAIDNAVLILMAEAILGLIVLAIVLFFMQRKKFNQEMNEIDIFISQLDEQIDLKSKPLDHLLSKTCKLDRDTVDKTLQEISESERALLHGVIKLLMQREMSLLQELDQKIGNLSQPYCEILKKVASQPPEVATHEASGLEYINLQLVRQLETAMQTIDEITAEYTRVFSGNQTELELENSRKKMLQVFMDTEYALRHPDKK